MVYHQKKKEEKAHFSFMFHAICESSISKVVLLLIFFHENLGWRNSIPLGYVILLSRKKSTLRHLRLSTFLTEHDLFCLLTSYWLDCFNYPIVRTRGWGHVLLQLVTWCFKSQATDKIEIIGNDGTSYSSNSSLLPWQKCSSDSLYVQKQGLGKLTGH